MQLYWVLEDWNLLKVLILVTVTKLAHVVGLVKQTKWDLMCE